MTGMAFRIRAATPLDAEVITKILITSRRTSWPHLLDAHDHDVQFWIDRWSRYLSEGSRAQFALGDGFVFLAEHDNQPVGFAAYHHTTRHGTEAELQSIYVLKDAQRQGLGTTFLQLICSELRADGSRSMCVGYDARNPYKRFYLKHGAVELNSHWAIWRDLNIPGSGEGRALPDKRL